MIIQSMKGLGDNILQRAFVKSTSQPVYLDTPWPELYSDLQNVHFTKPSTMLRTQHKNICRQHIQWESIPVGHAMKRISYGNQGMFHGMRQAFGFDPVKMDLPDFGVSLYDSPYVVVRPVTVRSEWRADSRNPKIGYVTKVAELAKQLGYLVISVADLEDGKEWALEIPPSDIQFHRGELTVSQLLNLTQNASALIGGIGWIVPASMAQNVPAFIVCGGQGQYNHPSKITDSLQQHRITFAMPDKFCMCATAQHDCNKEISNFDELVNKFFEEIK